MSNKIARIVYKVNNTNLPSSWKQFALSWIFNSQVKMAGTAGIHIEFWSKDKSVVHLKNKRRVQNHIGGVHAVGMALLAESATGMIVGMNVPDSHLPLMKSLKMSYVKRAVGDLKAVATLSPEQINDMKTKDRGDVLVNVSVTDSGGNTPCNCEMLWAWTTKQKKSS